MGKFDKRKLFPLSWYFWNKGHDFNIFIFFIDILIYAIPISTILSFLLLNYLTK